MKIKKIDCLGITFDNGNKLLYNHEKECCERVYADWLNMQIMTKMGVNSVNTNDLDFNVDLDKKITKIQNVGFEIEDNNGIRLFVSCYNKQNGYYSSNLELHYIKKGLGRTIIDISDCVKDEDDCI